MRFRINNPLQRRRLSASPNRSRPTASLGKPSRQILGPGRIIKPGRVPHRRVHRDRNRQRPGRHQIVDDRRNRIDPNIRVIALPRQLKHRIGDKILGPQSFFNMGQKFIRRFDKIRALPADPRRLGDSMVVQRPAVVTAARWHARLNSSSGP